MDLLKVSTEWAKDEVFSTKFFIAFAILFILGSIGFWQLGKIDQARAYIYPLLVTGLLLMTIGVGLFYNNVQRVKNFPVAYGEDAEAFFQSEKARVDRTMAEYRNVFKVIPSMIVVAALLIFFFDNPLLRAICISTIGMLIVILVVDGNAGARMAEYNEKLLSIEKATK